MSTKKTLLVPDWELEMVLETLRDCLSIANFDEENMFTDKECDNLEQSISIITGWKLEP